MRRDATLVSGNLAYLASQAVLILVLSRLTTTAFLGQYAFATAVLAPIFFFARMGVPMALATGTATEDEAGHQLSAVAAIAIALALTVAVLALSAGGLGYLDPTFAAILSLIALVRCIENVFTALNGYRLGRSDHGSAASAMWARSLAPPLALALFASETGMALLGLAAYAATHFALSMTMDLRLLCRVAMPISSRTGRALRGKSALGASNALAQFHVAAPRIFCGSIFGAATLGSMAPALQIFTLAGAAGVALLQPSLPRLARHGRRVGGGVSAAAMLHAASIGVLGIATIPLAFLLGGPVIAVVFGPGFENSGPLLGWLAIAWTLNLMSLALQNAYVVSQTYLRLLRLNLLVALTATIVTPLFLAFFGLLGVGLTVIAQATIGLGIALLGMPSNERCA